MPPKTYTVKEVADILEYSTNSIYTFLKEKRIKGVRVGKGRFRIPQAELDRLLSSSPNKKGAAQAASSVTPVASPAPLIVPQGDDATVEPQQAKYAHMTVLGNPLLFPNIFEWFVGVSAVLSGIALFLFNTTGPHNQATGFALILPMVRIVLVAGGVGVLLSSMFTKPRSIWRRIFHGILSLMGIVNAIVLLRGGDLNAALIYGVIALFVGVNIFVPIGGILAATLYIVFLLATAPVAVFLAGANMSVAPVIEAIPLSFPVVAGIFALFSSGSILCVVVGYRRRNGLYAVGMLAAAVAALAVAFWFGQINYWSRAFFFVVVALTAVFLPMWRKIQYEGSKREKVLAHGMFAAVSAILCVAVFVVGFIQAQAWNYNKNEFANKQEYGSILVDTVFNTTQSVLMAAAENPNLATGIRKNDEGAINAAIKVAYEGNEYVRRVVVLDAKGFGLLLYPPGEFTDPDLSFRDYYIAVRDTRAPYVSNLFQAQADEQRYVVAVAVPALDKKTDEFVGVLVGSVDLDRLAHKLQQVAIEDRGSFLWSQTSRARFLFMQVAHASIRAYGTMI